MGAAKQYYAVARGRKPGIYRLWAGAEGAEAQVRGWAGALYKGFATLDEARHWMDNPGTGKRVSTSVKSPALCLSIASPDDVIIFTDGACRGNPGPGGYGAIIVTGEEQIELAKGYRRTTNNRMELMACIAAIGSLKSPTEVTVFTDSRYVVHGIEKGWARKWRANSWMRTKSEAAQNSDLWAELLALCDRHRVRFLWIEGHAGHAENERCDRLAVAAAQGTDLNEDRAYVEGRPAMAR
jgi:ribonuclease HI